MKNSMALGMEASGWYPTELLKQTLAKHSQGTTATPGPWAEAAEMASLALWGQADPTSSETIPEGELCVMIKTPVRLCLGVPDTTGSGCKPWLWLPIPAFLLMGTKDRQQMMDGSSNWFLSWI